MAIGSISQVINVVTAASRIGAPAVAMTKNPESTLAQECEYTLPIVVDGEAGPHGLAPTTSTTVTLGLGDALAMVLMEEKQFSAEQFAAFHPGGHLGRRLAVKVADLMRTGDQIPVVRGNETFATAIREMTNKGLGVTFVTDAEEHLIGILTDGDLRRLLVDRGKLENLDAINIVDYVIAKPKTVERDASASEALRIMEVNGITSLAILDSRGKPEGIIHIHDILGRAKFMV